MNAPATVFVDELLRVVPELAHTYDQHLAYHGELLAHVLFGDVTRFARRCLREGRDDALVRLLGHLEAGLTSRDDDVLNLIGVSFAENLAGEDEEPRIRQLAGPLLKAQLKNFAGS